MDQIKNAPFVVLGIAALAFGGAAVAGAASGGDGSSPTRRPVLLPQGSGGLPPQRAGETLER